MKPFWKFVYSFVALPLMWTALQTLGLFNSKVRRGIRGRKFLFGLLERQAANIPSGRRVWFHASSLGEFEQAKPIIAALKQQYPDVRIIVTFFSPSGYEHSRKFQQADVVSYIPFDTKANAQRFLDITKPDIAIIIRYDVWPNHIWELRRRGIPILIANATMRPNTKRRLPLVRDFHYHIYNEISNILTVSQSDADAFKIFSLTNPLIEPIGDTRYDQVSIRSSEATKRHIIAQNILEGKRILVAGSTWPEDEEVLIPVLFKLQSSLPNFLSILVPHEPTIEHIEELEGELRGKSRFIRFSGLNEYDGENVIIVDSIGILLTLYTYAHIAYIGGSFKQNVHNVLEAAVYGVPVLYGPRHENSQEAVQLAQTGGGFVVNGEQELLETLSRLCLDESARNQAGAIAAAFVRKNIGATERFLKHLEKYLV